MRNTIILKRWRRWDGETELAVGGGMKAGEGEIKKGGGVKE